MRVRALSAGQLQCFADEGDPVVLTDLTGTVAAGPFPVPANQQLVIDYDGPRLNEVCWGILNPDGTLAYRSNKLDFGPLYRHQRVTSNFEEPPGDHLTPDDRKWLTRVTGFVR